MIAPMFSRTLYTALARSGIRRAQRATFVTSASLKSGDGARAPRGVKSLMQGGGEASSPALFKSDFSLADKVALVTGGNRGLGLEGALALAEAGARAVYCVDIAGAPGMEWFKVKEYVSRLHGEEGGGRLEYIRGDIRDQEHMWKIGKMIGDREGRLDACFAAAGITGEAFDGLRIPEERLQEVLDVNLKGTLFTAQAAGQQMERFGNGGSIIMVSSVAGLVTVNFGMTCYELAKSGVHQLARSLGCELAPKGIRVNTISPGFFQTTMVETLYQGRPDLVKILMERNPMKRIAEPHEMRGTVVWLASDASSFCTGTDIAVDGGHCAC